MKRAAPIAVLVIVVVAVLGVAKGWWQGAEDPVDPLPADTPIHWVNTTLWEFALSVPEPWSKTYRATHPDYVHFSGPKDDEFMPQLQFKWSKKEMKSAAWSEWNVTKFRNAPGYAVFDEGEATVAGMPARYLVYGLKQKTPGTDDVVEYRTIDFYFAGHGHVGMLRGVSTARTFLDTYRRLFTQIAHRLRYRG